MKKLLFLLLTAAILVASCARKQANINYNGNREPLRQNAYIRLPLGTVKPAGWLKEQLAIQASGLTGHLDEFWPDLMNSSWQGGDGEAWERGPYYLDGLVPLAYLLEDPKLIEKSEKWISHIISTASDSGWYGPAKNKDRWPLAVANKVLMQYYEATGDEKALNVITGYFRYLHNSRPDWPDKEWRGVRAMENAVTGYWLFRQTGEPWILEAIEKIQKNSSDWTSYYETFPWDSAASAEKKIPLNWGPVGLTAHVVNNAMAIKYPGLWYQQSGDERFRKAVFDGIRKYDLNHGQAGGRFSGDEHLSGKSPSQGTELCAVVEYMYSLQELYAVFGSGELADRQEKLAYNSFPGTITADMWAHQYDQQSNQVLVNEAKRGWSTNKDFSNIYGLMPNFACCLANMHQGWPKFVSGMWMATNDNGLAIVSYGPSVVDALAGKGTRVRIEEITDYPFGNKVTLVITSTKKSKFPIELRIPGWADSTMVLVKGKKLVYQGGELCRLVEKWENGDTVHVEFPMDLRAEKRYNGSVSVLRGPLVFSLRIEKEYRKAKMNYENPGYLGSADWEIIPASSWNYGLIIGKENLLGSMEVKLNPVGKYPFADKGDPVWSADSLKYITCTQEPPVVITARGIRIPDWTLKDNSADVPPLSPVSPQGDPEKIILIPYGSAKLRITEFPVMDIVMMEEIRE